MCALIMRQASLVAQFLCTIPLASVETVLAWLKPTVPAAEQAQLCRQVQPFIQHLNKSSQLRQPLAQWLRCPDRD